MNSVEVYNVSTKEMEVSAKEMEVFAKVMEVSDEIIIDISSANYKLVVFTLHISYDNRDYERIYFVTLNGAAAYGSNKYTFDKLLTESIKEEDLDKLISLGDNCKELLTSSCGLSGYDPKRKSSYNMSISKGVESLRSMLINDVRDK